MQVNHVLIKANGHFVISLDRSGICPKFFTSPTRERKLEFMLPFSHS